VTPSTPALLTLTILGIGVLLTRVAPRKETRAIAVAHAGLGFLAACVGVFVAEGGRRELFDGALVIDGLVSSMLPVIAVVALSLALATPTRETGHRTMAQALALPTLVGLSLMADRVWLLVALDGLIVLGVVSACPTRARRAQLFIRGLGLACVVTSLATASRETLMLSSELAARTLTPASAMLMITGIALQTGIGPAAIMHRAALSSGVSERGILSVLPFAGLALLVRVGGPALAHGLSPDAAHGFEVLLLVIALLTAGLLLVQRTVGAAFALALSAVNTLCLAGLTQSTAMGRLGGEVLWIATMVSATGFAVCLLALRARHGRLGLHGYSGYYSSSPRVAAFLLLFAVALGGVPGTLNFAALDLVLHSDLSDHLDTMTLAAATMAVFGFGMVRTAFHLLFGRPPRDEDDDDMPILGRELNALVPLAVLLIVAGLVPAVLPVVEEATFEEAPSLAEGWETRPHARNSTPPLATPRRSSVDVEAVDLSNPQKDLVERQIQVFEHPVGEVEDPAVNRRMLPSEIVSLNAGGLDDADTLLLHVEFDQPSVAGLLIADRVELVPVQPVDVTNLTEPAVHEPEILGLHRRLDSSTSVVPDDNDVVHLERIDRVVDDRVDVQVGVDHEVGDVPVDEHFSGCASHDLVGRNPRVGAADIQEVRRLSGGERFEEAVLLILLLDPASVRFENAVIPFHDPPDCCGSGAYSGSLSFVQRSPVSRSRAQPRRGAQPLETS